MTRVDYKQFEFIYFSNLDKDLENVLSNQYQLNEVDIEDIYSDTQLSKIEIRLEYVYIALQFPIYDVYKQDFLIKDLHCFCFKKRVIIIDKQEYKHFKQFLTFQNQLMEDEESTSAGLFLAELLDFCMTKTYKAIMKFDEDLSQVESDLFAFMDDIDVLKDILTIKKSLVNFESVIIPFRRVISDLESKTNQRFTQEELERLDNSLDTVNKMLNKLNNFQDQIDILMQVNDSMMIRSTSISSKNIFVATLFGFSLLIGLVFVTIIKNAWVENNILLVNTYLSLVIVLISILFLINYKK
jgi:Mg2+ and Co2+ transporter CorA